MVTAVGTTLQLSIDETQALKSLPAAMQITAKKALQGSLGDLARLIPLIWIKDASRFSSLVPIFHAILDSVRVPNYINSKTTPIIMRAKWALMGLMRISTFNGDRITKSDAVTNNILKKWEQIYPWMRFFARNCLPPPYDVSLTPPRPDLCNVFETINMCLHPITFICQTSEEGRHMLRSSVSVQNFVAQLWTLIGNLKDDALDGDPRTTGDRLQVSILRATFPITNYVCISESEAPDRITLPLSNYIHAAGGVKPVVFTLLRYIRRITRDAAAVKEPQSWTPNDRSVRHLHVFTTGLRYSFQFLQIISQQDASCRAHLIRQGSIRTVVDAITQILPRILVQANEEMDLHAEMGLAARQHVLWTGYSYIASAIRDADDGVTSVCQAIDAGLLETMPKGVVCPPHSNRPSRNHPPRGRMGDVELLFILATFFVYHRVAGSIFRHWFRMQNSPMIEPQDRRNEGLGLALQLVMTASCDAMDHATVEPMNFHEYRCSGPGCRMRASGFVSKKRRCSGCLISLYCSEKCQRAAWRSGHKKWCQVLRCTVGPWGSRDIRKSLQVIGGFETSVISKMAKDVETSVREARQQFPAFSNKFVLMLDMTVFPTAIHILPLQKLEHFPGEDPIWPEIADEIRERSDSPPKGYMFSVVKVHLGKSKYTLFSPSTALDMAFECQYLSDDEPDVSVDKDDDDETAG